jgi:hypothetical protein
VQPRTDRLVTITKPGLIIRVAQRFYPKYDRFAPWLDVAMTLNQRPAAPISGVLGKSLAQAVQAGGADSLSASFAAKT